MYGPVISVFVKPIGDELGWSRGEIAVAFTGGSLVGMGLSVLVGKQLDRYGARVAVVVGGMIVTGALVGLALMQEVWQFWLFFGAGRAAALAGINLGVSVAVVNWFVRKRGRAVAYLSISLRGGQALYPLLITALIVGFTWRHAFAVLAVISLVFLVLPAWPFLRRRPADMGLLRALAGGLDRVEAGAERASGRGVVDAGGGAAHERFLAARRRDHGRRLRADGGEPARRRELPGPRDR